MQAKLWADMELHISRAARDRYQFDETLFSINGNVVFANFHGARMFAQKMNDHRDLIHFPEQNVRAGHINTMGLIHEILHFVSGLYREQKNPQGLQLALTWLDARLGKKTVDDALRRFVNEFPPLAVYRGETDPNHYLESETAGIPHRQQVLEEMLLLWLENMNPAFSPFLELFDDSALERETAYLQIIAAVQEFFVTQPPFGPDSQNLVDMLRSPAVAVPHSLSGQLAFILEKWGHLLGGHLYRLLGGLDLLKEEERPRFFGAGPARVYQFAGQELEPERFSADREWMGQLVLMAKNTYVWLDQLSRKYQRSIHRLDQIPEEELSSLAQCGFSGLWLIGLWERSAASQKVKQLCGNPEAVASAYSLHDYQIAADLGGDKAYQNLKDRSWRHGLRLASDMVANHMGIDSKWVIEHPDWFIAVDHSPFPSYRFSGPDLSRDGRVGIFLDDHYYARTDAAVVFKRLDRQTGSEHYIYHGNDGTSMPWNDTAQLNFLKAEVREAVMQTILHVARKFPIIRFDAAMTLAKKHYQRLWFPEPGSGGAIPSRADHRLTKEQFDSAMPREFWREVVDRVSREVPDTLLMAEAFWLMEGFFVRTLGMHRVYNSAFMNMLKNEENANYRSVMKNTLEFNPEILKRFVNFMNNPDEETAEAQFGKGDKYFGVCAMLATLPGLPMFGHGQVEGLTEKYGMEFRRAYRNEEPDGALVQRHEREIFPLLRRRHLFAEIEHFLLYDFFTSEGHVNEDVFAYSNRSGSDRALVIYHNKYASTGGWIRTSVGFLGKTGTGDARTLMQKNLGTGLELHDEDSCFCIFRDHVTNLEYIRSSRELFHKGLYLDLAAYKCHVFLDFREVREDEGRRWSDLARYLDGMGVPSIDEALKQTFLLPIHHPFKELVNPRLFRQLMDARLTPSQAHLDASLLDDVEQKALRLARAAKEFTAGAGDEGNVAREVRQKLAAVLQLPVWESRLSAPSPPQQLPAHLLNDPITWGSLFGWVFVHNLGRIVDEANFPQRSRSWIDEWRLGPIIAGTMQDLGLGESSARQVLALIKLLTSHQNWFVTQATEIAPEIGVLESLLKDGGVQQFLQVNRHQDILWFNKEALDQLLSCLWLLAVVDATAMPSPNIDAMTEELVAHHGTIRKLQQVAEESEYQLERLLAAANQ